MAYIELTILTTLLFTEF